MCMHAQEVFFSQIRSIKKPVTFFKNGCKKKLFEMHCSLEKNCLQVPKMVTPPPIKNNGPSLRSLHLTASVLTASVLTAHDRLVNIDRNNMSSVVLFNIKKAFDAIDFEILPTKLGRYRIRIKEVPLLAILTRNISSNFFPLVLVNM